MNSLQIHANEEPSKNVLELNKITNLKKMKGVKELNQSTLGTNIWMEK